MYVAALGSRAQFSRLSSGARAELLCSMWSLPGPGIEPVSPALEGGFLTTEPPQQSLMVLLKSHSHPLQDALPSLSAAEAIKVSPVTWLAQGHSWWLCPLAPSSQQLLVPEHPSCTSQLCFGLIHWTCQKYWGATVRYHFPLWWL